MSAKSIAVAFAVAILLPILGMPNDAAAAEIKLLATAGARAALSELLPQFEARTGHKVNADFAPFAVLKRRIDAGENFDVVILSPALIDELIKHGNIAADTRIAFARTGLAVVVAQGGPKPDISTVENFRRALLNAKALAYVREGESGAHFLEILNQLGIAEEMRPKLKPLDNARDAIQKGAADMVVNGMGPAMETPASEYLGGLPSAIQRYLPFAAGVSAATKHPEAARALLRFLMSPDLAPAFRAKGLEQGVN